MLEGFFDRKRDARPNRRTDARPQRDEREPRGYQPNTAFAKGNHADALDVEYNVQNLLRDLYGDQVSTRLEDADTHWKCNIVCPREIRGRVIGTQGRMINAIRTIAGAHAAQRKVQVQIDLEE